MLETATLGTKHYRTWPSLIRHYTARWSVLQSTLKLHLFGMSALTFTLWLVHNQSENGLGSGGELRTKYKPLI